MLDIFRAGPLFHTDPELSALRAQLSKRAVIVVYVLFGILLLTDLLIQQFKQQTYTPDHQYIKVKEK